MLDDRLQHYRKTLYALAMLHCSMQERKKFVPVGWNIPYAFTLDDLLVSQR
jgi:dynein heavy chain